MDRPVKPLLRRPALAFWLWSRGYTWREAGRLFDTSGEAVRHWCCDFADPTRSVPTPRNIARIASATAGEITAVDFYPPHLTRAPPAEPQEAAA